MATRRSWHLFGARNQARSGSSGSSGSSPAAVAVGELSPVEFIARLDQLVAVYAAAMRPAPELLAGRRTIMAGHAGNPGFRALAVTDDGTGETVGFGYGFHGAAGQWWHDTVSRALAERRGDEAAAAWAGDSFEVAELHVAPDHQGHGIGARLLRAAESTLAEQRGATSFRLHTGHRSEGNLRLYRKVGYQTVGTSRGADGVEMIVLEKPAGQYAATA